MVLLYTPQKTAKSGSMPVAEIFALDYQGLGIAKIDGKIWFVENALPTEKVQLRVIEEKRRHGFAASHRILRASEVRQAPKCRYFEQCGGCQGQHIPIEMQRRSKQQALVQQLTELQTEPIEVMPMICGEPWQYRRRLRLSIMYNAKSQSLDIGLRRKNSTQIVNIQQCEVIVPELNLLLPELTALLRSFSAPRLLGHIELVAADNGIAMLLRHHKNLAPKDRTLLLDFARERGIMLFVQDDRQLSRITEANPLYRLPPALELNFDIRDFIQINAELNRRMVSTALDWLDLNQSDNVLDLFCGMGNFTLPLGRRAKSAIGIEGVEAMVEKARINAEQNQCENVKFYRTDLDKSFDDQPWAACRFDKILLDPPRSGAAFALKALCRLQARRILYVSCNPATLVRDAALLLEAGYIIRRTAMIDMFPHTGHLESMTLFVKKE
ncbi:23S rRNA m(5)U-1939 methyltransferase [Mesocricetibacter intestinalis]|uniref:23S rRNA (uracil(1939)-C(5))-methyltransferase RlmD n=1 Tax=Mesocricetibacter intestinalis TaxID=1521930 RepID=A0A4R6VHB9_9PAST|nr:23S rRNA (uracil(1939)-C(5))-methyltransferase RlmD [Mesocricetibacter intestinalis]TDQ57618.1 23S rRNA m(5)U-1939 methyltransferase [Mesocricetibacter intestinalis]